MADAFVGKSTTNETLVEKLDTTNMDKNQVLEKFKELVYYLDNSNVELKSKGDIK